MSGDAITDQSRAELWPLTYGAEEEGQAEIGRVETGEFIALPAEGAQLLRWLGEGLTVGEVKERFAAAFGQEPDVADFLNGLAEVGFVRAIDGRPVGGEPERVDGVERADPQRGWRLFTELPQARVAWLVSSPMLWVYALIWIGVPLAVLLQPELLPRSADLWFSASPIINLVGTFAIGWVLTLVHESAHLIALRALGLSGALSLSNRLIYLVAHVEMSGVRSLSRRQRYIPYLAGMTWDLFLLALCAGLQLAGLGLPIIRLIAFLLSMSLLFQCALYMRTDLYYVLTNALRLGNLMADTQAWLLSLGARLLGRRPGQDLSGVPARELRLVRWYALLYVLGVGVTLGQFILFGLPLLARYAMSAVDGLRAGPGALPFWDGLTLLLLIGLNWGLFIWVRWRERGARRRSARTAA